MLPSSVAAGSAPAYAGIALPRAAKGRQAAPDSRQTGSSFQDFLAEGFLDAGVAIKTPVQSVSDDMPAKANGANAAATGARQQSSAGQPNAVTKAESGAAVVAPGMKELFVNILQTAPVDKAVLEPAAAGSKPPQPAPGEPKAQPLPAPNVEKKPVAVSLNVKAFLLQGGIPSQFAFLDVPPDFSGPNANTPKSPSTPAAAPGAPADATHSADDLPPAAQGVNLAAANATANPIAFAMRVTPADQKTVSDETAVNNSTARPQISIATDSVVAPITPHPQQEHKEDASSDGFPAHALELDAPKTEQSFKEHFETPETAKASDPEPEPAAATASSAKYVSVRVSGDGAHRVDFRVIERDGIMSVSVKSADPALNRTLQEHMPELTTRLESEHFRTEVWVPKADGAAATSSAGSSGSNSNSGYSSSGNGGGQYSGEQERHPEWLDDLESYGRALRKRRHTTWRQ